MGRGLGWVAAAFAASTAAVLACSSFDAAPASVDALDGATEASGGDAAAADDAPGDPDAGCRVVLDETFTSGLGEIANVFVDDGGTLGVSDGVLKAQVPRPGGSFQSQVENNETTRTGERRYKLRFVLRSLAPGVSGDHIRVGCTLKLIQGADHCDVFAGLSGNTLRADDDCSTTVTSATDLRTIDGKQGDLLVSIETLFDPTSTSFRSVIALDGGASIPRAPITLAPTKWQVKCGIDEATLATGPADAGPYGVAVDDVHLELCER